MSRNSVKIASEVVFGDIHTFVDILLSCQNEEEAIRELMAVFKLSRIEADLILQQQFKLLTADFRASLLSD